jgi:carbon monoxide dehydrogenase subunit G
VKIERSVEVARPHDEVWAVLREPALMPAWFNSLENFATVLGDGTQAGDKYTIDYMRESGSTRLSVEVLEVDEPDGHVHLFKGLPVAFSITSRLSGDGSTTVWSATIEVKLSLVQRALGPVIKGTLDGLADDMSESFKQYVEAQ